VAELSPRVFFHQVGRMVANVPETSNLANISCTPAVIGLLAMLSSAPLLCSDTNSLGSDRQVRARQLLSAELHASVCL